MACEKGGPRRPTARATGQCNLNWRNGGSIREEEEGEEREDGEETGGGGRGGGVEGGQG